MHMCTPCTRANDTANYGGFSLPVTLVIDSLICLAWTQGPALR